MPCRLRFAAFRRTTSDQCLVAMPGPANSAPSLVWSKEDRSQYSGQAYSLLEPGYVRGDGNRRHYLSRCQQVPPRIRTTEDLLGNYDDIARLHLSFQDVVAIPATRVFPDHRTVGANHEDLLLARHAGGTSGMA